MSPERETWAIALRIEQTQGKRGPLFVTERIGALAAAGDMAGVERWKQVAAALDRMRRDNAIR